MVKIHVILLLASAAILVSVDIVHIAVASILACFKIRRKVVHGKEIIPNALCKGISGLITSVIDNTCNVRRTCRTINGRLNLCPLL